MKFQIVQPSGFLKKHIKNYCFMESDIYDADVMERVIPTENIQLMFHYKNPFVVFHSNDTVIKQPRSIISGLSDNYFDVSTAGETGVVFISFQPTGACHFFNFPLSEIENLSVDLNDILNSEIRQIEELLYLKETIREKVTVIENFLIRHYSPIPSHDGLLIQKGVEIVKSCKGQTNAKYLSDCLYTTPKTLERKFSIWADVRSRNNFAIIFMVADFMRLFRRYHVAYRPASKCSNSNQCRFSFTFFKHNIFTKRVDNG